MLEALNKHLEKLKNYFSNENELKKQRDKYPEAF